MYGNVLRRFLLFPINFNLRNVEDWRHIVEIRTRHDSAGSQSESHKPLAVCTGIHVPPVGTGQGVIRRECKNLRPVLRIGGLCPGSRCIIDIDILAAAVRIESKPGILICSRIIRAVT
ncbi:hypothetical protein D3C73_1165060 [compost metagenome]